MYMMLKTNVMLMMNKGVMVMNSLDTDFLDFTEKASVTEEFENKIE